MTHESSWFQLLLGSSYPRLNAAAQPLGWPFNDQGKTWLSGEAIGIEHVLGAALVTVSLLVLGFVVGGPWRTSGQHSEAALVPEARLSLRSVTDLLISSLYRTMSEIMGAEAAKTFLPLIGTCALFILFCNLLGLVPGFVPPTSTLNTTLGLSLVIIVTTHLYGLRASGGDYLKHFLGPMRQWYWLPLMLLIASIEIFSHMLVRPGSLAVRLMANMTADHMVLSTFHNLHPWVALGLPVVMYMLGTLVCVVQTLVFCMLSTVYIALAIQHQEH